MHINTSQQPALQLGFGDWACHWGVPMRGLRECDAEPGGPRMVPASTEAAQHAPWFLKHD